MSADRSDLSAALLAASVRGFTREVERLLRDGADPNWMHEGTRQRPLHGAVIDEHAVDAPGVVAALLGAGANPNVQDMNLVTPLHRAAVSGRAELVRRLLDAGAWPETRNNTGSTPLHDAGYANDVETARLLIEAGADINLRDHHRQSPLAYAVINKSVRLIRFLVANGARRNTRMAMGETPLTFAVVNKDFDSALALLNSRAPPRRQPPPTAFAHSRGLCADARAAREDWRNAQSLAQAERLFAEAAEHAPTDWVPQLGLGECLHLRLKHADEAPQDVQDDLYDRMMERLCAAVRLGPDQPEPHLLLADVVLPADRETAETLFRRAMDAAGTIEPDLYDDDWHANWLWSIGIGAAGHAGFIGMSIEAFYRAIKIDPAEYAERISPRDDRPSAVWAWAAKLHKFETDA